MPLPDKVHENKCNVPGNNQNIRSKNKNRNNRNRMEDQIQAYNFKILFKCTEITQIYLKNIWKKRGRGRKSPLAK